MFTSHFTIIKTLGLHAVARRAGKIPERPLYRSLTYSYIATAARDCGFNGDHQITAVRKKNSVLIF